MSIDNWRNLDAHGGDHPFPYIVIDGLWPDELLRQARAEFGDVSAWGLFNNQHEYKYCAPFESGGDMCMLVRSIMASEMFTLLIEDAFGIKDVEFDELGGGLHRIVPGGYLGMHVDFNRIDSRYRVVNALVFLNYDPDPSGDLLLAEGRDDPSPVHIRPIFGRTVLFRTSDTSWHGHPTPLQGDMERRSLAGYYYVPAPPDAPEGHSTIFAPDPSP